MKTCSFSDCLPTRCAIDLVRVDRSMACACWSAVFWYIKHTYRFDTDFMWIDRGEVDEITRRWW